MKITHTSPVKITKITNSGLFDDCLFFSDDEYVMTAKKGYFVYQINIDESEIIDASDLDDSETIEHISNVLNVDLEQAERFLDARDSVFDFGLDADDDWFIQSQRGAAAKLMGFSACRDEDEQGTVYIVPMLNKFESLNLVK
jgi:hypothetical protein